MRRQLRQRSTDDVFCGRAPRVYAAAQRDRNSDAELGGFYGHSIPAFNRQPPLSLRSKRLLTAPGRINLFIPSTDDLHQLWKGIGLGCLKMNDRLWLLSRDGKLLAWRKLF
ncbi:hypothetical protein AVEN_55689-1 [Araneus ventricosus]|uniref:Uncharacterized protein n=1 Tax=Araneus ventricosus TaxID=182803 RepID=A0A4Y2J0K0_ARAVE|nr:hypothetical protein AVEN_55689-1 [Araneus ventricosus]